MSVIDKFVAKAVKAEKKIVLPEGHDPRVVVAANMIVEKGIADVLVLGSEEEIRNSCEEAHITSRLFQTMDHLNSEYFDEFVHEFCELRKKKNMTTERATEYMKNRIFFGSMMIRKKICDGLVAGSIASTADMLRASFMVVGTAPGIKTASSCFIMDLKDPAPNGEEVLLYADCAVNPEPSSEQLADIAIATANNYKALLDRQPKLAFLSFSTYGSASHPLVEKVQNAVEITKQKVAERNLDIIIDGELQADSALVPAVAAKKCPKSIIAGNANVLIFPDLNSGNICYKITQRLAGALALGPVLQGLSSPMNDLSRGCSAEDICGVAAITVCQSIGS